MVLLRVTVSCLSFQTFAINCNFDNSSMPDMPNCSLQEKTIRTVRHYHYLQWKDFNAPEHAPGMLHFIKRINEEASRSSEQRPIVVHCSAGVGRSGTLVRIYSEAPNLMGSVDPFKSEFSLRTTRFQKVFPKALEEEGVTLKICDLCEPFDLLHGGSTDPRLKLCIRLPLGSKSFQHCAI